MFTLTLMITMAEKRIVIDSSELDLRFPRNVMKQPGGEAIQKCFQCAVCVANCPIRAIETGYNPRKIIKMTLLGMKDKVYLKSSFGFVLYVSCAKNVVHKKLDLQRS